MIWQQDMIPNIEADYERIANAMIAALPGGWTEAKMTAIFYADNIDWEPEFRMASGGPRSFDVSMELTRAFRDLRRKFRETDQPQWGQAEFLLYADGRFNMKWGYDNCDEHGDTIWNAEEWHRRQEERKRRLSQQ